MKTKTLLFALFISCFPTFLLAQTFTQTQPDPNHNNLNVIWAYDSTHVFAGGVNETFLKYDGNSWIQIPISFSSFSVWSIYGSSPTDVWLTGGTDLAHYNGSSVTRVNIGNTNLLRKIFGFSASDIYLCGNNGTLMHYDGSSWNSISSSFSNLNFESVWGLSGSDLFFCGWDTYYPYTNRIIHYDGSTFTELKTFTETDKYLQDIWSPDNNLFYLRSLSGLYCYNKTSNNLSLAYSGVITCFCGIDTNNFIFTSADDYSFRDTLVVYHNGVYKSAYSSLNNFSNNSICAVNNNLSNVFFVGEDGWILHTDLTAGISAEIESLVKFNAYPNPSNGQDINIELNFNQNTKVEVVVLNSVGQRIETVFSGNSWGKESLKIDKNLPSGIYFVKVTTDNGNSCSRKIVVTK